MADGNDQDMVRLLNPFLEMDREPLKAWIRQADEASKNEGFAEAQAILERGGLPMDETAFDAVDMVDDFGFSEESLLLERLLEQIGLQR